MQTPCLEGPDDNMGILHRVLQQDYQVTVVARDLPVGETPSEVKNSWSAEVVAQAQRDDPDISVVLSHLLKEWRKPVVEELRSMSYAALAVWAQLELLLLQQGVLYIKSAGHTTQAKLRMVLPKQWRRPLSKFMMALLVPT